MLHDGSSLSIFLSDMEDSSYRLSYAKNLATQCLSQSASVAYERLQSYQKRLIIDINDCESIYDVNNILKKISSRSRSSGSLDESLSLFFEDEEDHGFQNTLIEEREVTMLSVEDRMDCTDLLLEGLNPGLPISTEVNNNVDVANTPLSCAASPECNVKSADQKTEEFEVYSRFLSSVTQDNNTSVGDQKRRRKSIKEKDKPNKEVKEKKVKKPVGRPSKVVSDVFEI